MKPIKTLFRQLLCTHTLNMLTVLLFIYLVNYFKNKCCITYKSKAIDVRPTFFYQTSIRLKVLSGKNERRMIFLEVKSSLCKKIFLQLLVMSCVTSLPCIISNFALYLWMDGYTLYIYRRWRQVKIIVVSCLFL